MPVENEILPRRLRWLGHAFRNITRQTLTWNPPGKKKRGRLCNSWRRDLEAAVKCTGKNWKELEKTVQDRVVWRQLVGVLCPRGVKSLGKVSWASGHFPLSRSQAIVIPIKKPGKDNTDSKNYRPIALTSCTCKTMERMINKRALSAVPSNK